MSTFKYISLFIIGLVLHFNQAYGQNSSRLDTLKLSLQQTIKLAQDSSLEAFIQENQLIASQWQYKNYQASKLTTIGINTQPFTFNRSITQQFVPGENSYQYFEVQNLNSYVQLSLDQNLPFSGGTISLDSDLGRLDNFGSNSNLQYSATQVRVGYRQPLFAYNQFKWDRILEPLRFERSKLEYVQTSERIALNTLGYFFDLASAELNMKIAHQNMQNADTLYSMGQKRFDIAAIKQADLLNLRLEYLNNKTAYTQASNNYVRTASRLKSYLNLAPEVEVSTELSLIIPKVEVPPKAAMEMARENNPDFLKFQEELYQAQSLVEKTRKDNRFRANLDASFGLNQRGSTVSQAYTNPLDQQRVNVGFYIPIVDWGLAKGRYKMAQRQMQTTALSIKQREIELEQEIAMTILEFNLKAEVLKNSKEAADVAEQAYEIGKQRFIQGLSSVNDLIIQQQKRDTAQKRYFSEFQAFWRSYYLIRNLTLFDFESNASLVEGLDKILGHL